MRGRRKGRKRRGNAGRGQQRRQKSGKPTGHRKSLPARLNPRPVRAILCRSRHIGAIGSTPLRNAARPPPAPKNGQVRLYRPTVQLRAGSIDDPVGTCSHHVPLSRYPERRRAAQDRHGQPDRTARAHAARASAAQPTTADAAGDSLCIYQQLGAGSRFSGNPEFCIHRGMFATVYSDLPYDTAPLAADGFHLRILKVPAADLRLRKRIASWPVSAISCRNRSANTARWSRFWLHASATCKKPMTRANPSVHDRWCRRWLNWRLIERGVIRPGSRAALHALRVGRLSLARRLIARNISRAALSPAMVADLLGISVRHLHILFEAHRHQLCPDRDRRAPRRKPPAADAAPAAVDFGYRSCLRLRQHRDVLSGVPGGPRHVAGRVQGNASGARIATATLDLAEVK